MIPKLQTAFNNKRIIGLCGEKSSGKTNNLYHLIKEFRNNNNKTPIYCFGMPPKINNQLAKLKVKPIGSLKQLIHKKDCLLILDEFQKLKLNDRRYKDQLQEFIDFVYHNNVYVILSSPDIREFNSVIGGVVEQWLLKSVRIDQCINGSQLKRVIDEYKGQYKVLGSIIMPLNKVLVINDEEETTLDCPYEEEADTKKCQKNVFGNVKELSSKMSGNCQERRN